MAWIAAICLRAIDPNPTINTSIIQILIFCLKAKNPKTKSQSCDPDQSKYVALRKPGNG